MRVSFYVSGGNILLVSVDSVFYDAKTETLTFAQGEDHFTFKGISSSQAKSAINELSAAGCTSLFETPEELKQSRAEALFK